MQANGGVLQGVSEATNGARLEKITREASGLTHGN